MDPYACRGEGLTWETQVPLPIALWMTANLEFSIIQNWVQSILQFEPRLTKSKFLQNLQKCCFDSKNTETNDNLT
jgi:hypothetical protein